MKKRIVSAVLLFVLLTALFCSAAYAANGGTIVYVTKSGECYHKDGCRYLSKSKIEITLEDAVNGGYRRCSVCKPPQLDGNTKPEPTPKPVISTSPKPVSPVSSNSGYSSYSKPSTSYSSYSSNKTSSSGNSSKKTGTSTSPPTTYTTPSSGKTYSSSGSSYTSTSVYNSRSSGDDGPGAAIAALIATVIIIFVIISKQESSSTPATSVKYSPTVTTVKPQNNTAPKAAFHEEYRPVYSTAAVKVGTTLYCRNGETVTVAGVLEDRILLQYKGKTYCRSKDDIGKTLFYENPSSLPF